MTEVNHILQSHFAATGEVILPLPKIVSKDPFWIVNKHNDEWKS